MKNVYLFISAPLISSINLAQAVNDECVNRTIILVITGGINTYTIDSNSHRKDRCHVRYLQGVIIYGSFEYILKPSSSVSEMQALHTTIQGGGKPYVVHQQNATAHINEIRV